MARLLSGRHTETNLLHFWQSQSIQGKRNDIIQFIVPKFIVLTEYFAFQLDTVSRVLIDRRWSVGDLAAATLRYAMHAIEERMEGKNSLFEEIIGMDKSSP